jgi:hypothetical protein
MSVLRHNRPAIRLMQACAVALGLAHASSARATPDFPAVVVKVLDLKAITIDPPQGCELCHTTDSGGTSLRPFGTLLQQYGAQPYQENTLEAALGQVAQNEPELIADIQASKDPNDDTDAASDVHTPEYGCATAPARVVEQSGSWALLLALGALGALKIRRSRARLRLRLPR